MADDSFLPQNPSFVCVCPPLSPSVAPVLSPTAGGVPAPGPGPAARVRWQRCPALGIATPAPPLQAAGEGCRQLSSPRPSPTRCHSFPALKYVFYYRLFNLMSNIPTALSTV